MKTYTVALVNHLDGTVQGHIAGCADLKRGTRTHASTPMEVTVTTKHDAFVDYNSDFIAEAEAEGDDDIYYNCYDIDWFPCAKHVPVN